MGKDIRKVEVDPGFPDGREVGGDSQDWTGEFEAELLLSHH
jgi:hypothetical protein